MSDTDTVVLATVNDIDDGTIVVERLFTPPDQPDISRIVKLTADEFDTLAVVVGDPMNPGDDLCQLEDVSDATILHTLRLKLVQEKIFTAIGPVLIVVNPYKPVDICAPDVLDQMSSEFKLDKVTYLKHAVPHCHKTVSEAYIGLLENTKGGGAQSILVSGESGAGKTETTKICMGCLAAISNSSGGITDAALDSSFVLEAVGNAKTAYNNNSSRFGKWMALHFDKNHQILACKIRAYLLEQSRVVGPAPGERNYHIFYYMIKGASEAERKKYGILHNFSMYYYTMKGSEDTPGQDDIEGWREMRAKFESIGVGDEGSYPFLQAIATVLNVGNLDYKEAGSDKMEVTDFAAVKELASQLGVEDTLFHNILVSKTMSTGRGSTYTIQLNASQCIDARDALAKGLYQASFDWLIAELNESLKGSAVPETDLRFIGFLDIFGFENFQYNTFEQLCINFTNERLQSHFMDALIKRQVEDYKKEEIDVDSIQFPDNSLQIKLIDANKGSVFSMLDEECVVPKGSDLAYVTKMIKSFEKPHKCCDVFCKPRVGRNGDMIHGRQITDKEIADLAKVAFVITHYAGPVVYCADRWLEKNRGALGQDVVSLLAGSSNMFVAKAFAVQNKDKKATVGYLYRASLRSLSDTMAATNQHYIRCLKPNMLKKSDLFHGDVLTRQLQYTGCGAVVAVQRSGYPVSMPQREFIRMYHCITLGTKTNISGDTKQQVEKLLTLAQSLSEDHKGKPPWMDKNFGQPPVQLGKTKVFMKDEVVKALEIPKRDVNAKAQILVARHVRGHRIRKMMRNVEFHQKAYTEIKAALAGGTGTDAADQLEALERAWENMLGLDTDSSLVAKLKRQLVDVKQEVDDLKDRVKIAWESGDRYEGAWRNENMNGKGTYYYADGNVYDGQWLDGNKHGYGTHTWVDGQVYTGQWEEDTMHGKGKYIFPNGNKYEGYYDNGVRHGKGKFTYANGGVYSGGFNHGKKHGDGTYHDPTGKLVYKGQWQDKEHGHGRFVFPNGAVYDGQFVKGKKEGEAKYSDPSGAVYEGQFVAGKRQGFGKYTDPSGAVAYQGEWKDGQPANL